jgi:hypothetical protein
VVSAQYHGRWCEAADDALAQLEGGLLGFLDSAATSRKVQQVILIDGPAVLGWQQWRVLEEKSGLGAIRALLDHALAQGAMPPQPLEALAPMLLAVVDEAALYVANAPQTSAAKKDAVAAMDRLLRGIRN